MVFVVAAGWLGRSVILVPRGRVRVLEASKRPLTALWAARRGVDMTVSNRYALVSVSPSGCEAQKLAVCDVSGVARLLSDGVV